MSLDKFSSICYLYQCPRNKMVGRTVFAANCPSLYHGCVHQKKTQFQLIKLVKTGLELDF
jgi:hypothetical protein